MQWDASDDTVTADYNVAPTKQVPAVLTRRPREVAETADPIRQLRKLRWGLVPSWAKDPGIGAKMINARGETVHEKPAFRAAFARRRCLLPADGYFEWQKSAESNRKQPYFLRPADGGLLPMAGLYELWRDPDKAEGDPDAWLATCTVITTRASDDAGTVHDRMPMTVPPDKWGEWLDPELTDTSYVRHLPTPAANGHLEIFPVSTAVNNVRNNGPELVRPQ